MAQWQKVIDAPGGFAMCGVYTQDKLHLGTYGTGNIYSWLPLAAELENSGEAVLAMCEFKGTIYATSENNDMEGQHTRILRRTGVGWVEAGAIKGYATFFMTVWGDYLVVTATTDLKGIDYWYSKDGSTWTKGAHFNDWVWVPTVFRNELYFLGHYGRVEDNNGSCAYKWNGSSFVEVPSLCRVPGVLEWQCATEHNSNFYLGAGGWVLGRGVSTAAVYKFNGQTCEKVLDGSPYHECQALLSSKINGYLYAACGHGFKSDEGGSQIWASKDGLSDWLDAGHFDCPQLYVMLDTKYGFIAAGGKQGNLSAFYFDTQAPQPEPEKEHTCPSCGFKF